MEGNRNWSMTVLGVTTSGISNWLRVLTFINGCAAGVGQPPVFDMPLEIQGGSICTIEIYDRATLRVRKNAEAKFFCDSEDRQLQEWFLAAKAHVLGLNVLKPL